MRGGCGWLGSPRAALVGVWRSLWRLHVALGGSWVALVPLFVSGQHSLGHVVGSWSFTCGITSASSVFLLFFSGESYGWQCCVRGCVRGSFQAFCYKLAGAIAGRLSSVVSRESFFCGPSAVVGAVQHFGGFLWTFGAFAAACSWALGVRALSLAVLLF